MVPAGDYWDDGNHWRDGSGQAITTTNIICRTTVLNVSMAKDSVAPKNTEMTMNTAWTIILGTVMEGAAASRIANGVIAEKIAMAW